MLTIIDAAHYVARINKTAIEEEGGTLTHIPISTVGIEPETKGTFEHAMRIVLASPCPSDLTMFIRGLPEEVPLLLSTDSFYRSKFRDRDSSHEFDLKRQSLKRAD